MLKNLNGLYAHCTTNSSFKCRQMSSFGSILDKDFWGGGGGGVQSIENSGKEVSV